MNDGGGAKLGGFARPVGLPLGQDSSAVNTQKGCRSKEGTTKNIFHFPKNAACAIQTLDVDVQQHLNERCDMIVSKMDGMNTQ